MFNHTDKFKIYYIKKDVDGNEIERGIHPKEYVYHGKAYSVANALYPKHEGYTFIIAQRDPFVKYTRDLKCELCGVEYAVDEHYNGHHNESYICFRDANETDRRRRTSYRELCPECIKKIREFLDSMAEGKE